MDIFEFELRYYSYIGLSTRLSLGRDESTILALVKKNKWWELSNHITQTSIEQLRDATKQTYTKAKKQFLQEFAQTTITPSWKTLTEYIERLEYELKVIDEMHYNTYFLVVQDYIVWARNEHIVVGPWRWSCAWSLLSYLIWITDLDPLEYDLIFERFLNPWRISMPDIDTDFEDTQRDKVIDYIRNKYWDDKVAHIWTYMTMAAKAACKDVARVMGLKFDQSNHLSSLITEKTVALSIEKNTELQAMIANDGHIKKIVDIAARMEGTVRQTWVHACWMIIAPSPAVQFTPLQHPPLPWNRVNSLDQRVVSQFDGPTTESIGLLKMDLLWLRNLSIIKNTIKILTAKSKKENLPANPLFQEFLETMYFHPPLDDTYTYQKIFAQGDTSWVFQFESDGMKNRLKKLKPTWFNDLIAMTSLYRPWPMDFIPHYVDRKHGVEKVEYMQDELFQTLKTTYWQERALLERAKLDEDLSPFMDVTYGIAVYQEQLMRIVQAMAWFSMIEADNLRKWVWKKIREIVEKIKGEFIKKAELVRGYAPQTAEWIYEKMIEPAADYSFNKSHAACYSYISYQTAYLKAHYPIEFHAALLRSVEEDTEKFAKFVNEIQLQGFTIALPDINSSFEHVSAINNTIQLWFLSIKWIGKEIAKHIEEERERNWSFVSLTDFLKRCKHAINKKSVESLIKSWTRDKFGDRETLLANRETIVQRVKTAEKNAGAMSLFGEEELSTDIHLVPTSPSQNPLQPLLYEYECFKTFISWHPLDGLYRYSKSWFNGIAMIKDTEWFWEFKIVCMVKEISRWMRWWVFMKVEDMTGEMEFYVNHSCDIAQFDILIIKWWKGRSAKIDTISTLDTKLIKKKLEKTWKWFPEETVARVRKQRNEANTIKPDNLTTTKQENTVTHGNAIPQENTVTHGNAETHEKTATWLTIEATSITTTKEMWSNQAASETIFPIPDDMQLLATIKKIVRDHPWSETIYLWTIPLQINTEGKKNLLALLEKNRI